MKKAWIWLLVAAGAFVLYLLLKKSRVISAAASSGISSDSSSGGGGGDGTSGISAHASVTTQPVTTPIKTILANPGIGTPQTGGGGGIYGPARTPVRNSYGSTPQSELAAFRQMVAV